MTVDGIEIDPRRGGDARVAQKLPAEGQTVIGQMADVRIDVERPVRRRDLAEAEAWQRRLA